MEILYKSLLTNIKLIIMIKYIVFLIVFLTASAVNAHHVLIWNFCHSQEAIVEIAEAQTTSEEEHDYVLRKYLIEGECVLNEEPIPGVTNTIYNNFVDTEGKLFSVRKVFLLGSIPVYTIVLENEKGI
tara:strand:- start:1347 stop:1730 length:384 start_codon:yes stop_codon:yes gene_type:complete